jgi:nucleotide-binding universal stress UspA family protein
MQLFNQILFPTDFSEASNHAMKYAIHLCRHSKANLLILYAYRLIDENPLEGIQVNISLKEKLEKQVAAKFSVLEKELLASAQIPYQLLSDVGFISDRIMVNMQLHQVDLLLLCQSMQHSLADSMQELLMQQEKCPVMFIPSHIVQPALKHYTL